MLPELQAIVISLMDKKDVLKLLRLTGIIQNLGYHIRSIKFDFSRSSINDNDLENLKRVHTIDLSDCNKITDKGLEYLKGVHTIHLESCVNITDKGLEHLKGVQNINFWYCDKITDEGLEHLKGVHTIRICFS